MVKDREAWYASVHGVTKNWAWLNNWTTTSEYLRLLIAVYNTFNIPWHYKDTLRFFFYICSLFLKLVLPCPSYFPESLTLSFFNFTILYWFCHVSTWICHRYTRVLHLEPSALPVLSLWVVPVYQPQASSIVYRTWTGDSFHVWYYTCFNALLPNHPTLSLSHRVQKTVLYISVSFAVSYTGLLLPSF